MKRVCFFVEKIDASGGIPRVVSIIANGLATNEFDVTILSLTKCNDNNIRYEINNTITIKYIYDTVSNLNYKINFLSISKKIELYFEYNNFDAVVVAGMDFVPFFYGISNKIINTKFIAWEHSNFKIGSKLGFRVLGRNIASKRFNSIVVLTDKDLNYYKTKYKNCNCSLLRIYNPIIEKTIVHEYDDKIKRIISVGALIYQKGFDYAIDVADNVLKKYPDWKWYIFGEGEEREKLQHLIDEKGLDNNLILSGYSDNIEKEYQKSAFFVLPSRFEGFCMVNLEAMQQKLPVVAFDFDCGPSEIIRDGYNGFIIKSFDVDEMASKIIELISKDKLRLDMSKKTEESLCEFRLEKIIEQWEDLFGGK